MKEIFVSQPAALLLLAFFVLGLYVYQAATILMKGSIFISLRNWIGSKAANSRFFSKIQEMLGCMLCTGTQVALWTIGLPATTLAFKNDFWRGLVGELAWYQNVPLTLLSGFALSLAIASLARGYFQIVEYRAERFAELEMKHDTERGRMRILIGRLQAENAAMLAGISARMKASNGSVESSPVSLRALLSLEAFTEIHSATLNSPHCSGAWCRYSQTSCQMEALAARLRSWWSTQYPQGYDVEIEVITGVIDRHGRGQKSAFYWLFWPDYAPDSLRVYDQLMVLAESELVSTHEQ